MGISRHTDLLILNHDSLIRPTVEIHHHELSGVTLNPSYEMSYEFAKFLYQYRIGEAEKFTSAQRCFKIATRKSSYGEKIIDDFGTFTEAGQWAVQNARIIVMKMLQWLRREHDFYNTIKLDEIIPYGQIDGYSMRFMHKLYDLLSPVERTINFPKGIKARTSMNASLGWEGKVHVVKEGLITDKPENWLLTSSFRNNAYARKSAEQLIKYGLVDIANLPRESDGTVKPGRGRAPVGIRLSPIGRNFLHGFLNEFDPRMLFSGHFARDAQEELDDTQSVANGIKETTDPGRMEPEEIITHTDDSDIFGGIDNQDIPHMPELDDQRWSQADIPEKPPSQPSPKSDPSDIDPHTGENLRDIFG